MITIIGSNNLGLIDQHLGSSALAGNALNQQQVLVNASTGNLVLRVQDEMLLGGGYNAGFYRTYNSQGFYSDLQTNNWHYYQSTKLVYLPTSPNTAGSSLIKINQDGSEVTYYFDENDNLYKSQAGLGAIDSISYNEADGTWTWQDGLSQQQQVFNSFGWLVASVSASGAEETYAYGTHGSISTVYHANGQQTYLDYDNEGRLEAVRTTQLVDFSNDAASYATRKTVRYSYDALGRLESIIIDLSPEDDSIADNDVFSVTYQYKDDTDLVSSIEQSDGQSMQFDYVFIDNKWHLSLIGQGGQTRYTLAYDKENQTTDLKDQYGNITSYVYDGESRLVEVISPAIDGLRERVSYRYDANDNLIEVIDASGNSVTYEYDDNGNLLAVKNDLGVARSYIYDTQNRQIAAVDYRSFLVAGSDDESTSMVTGNVYNDQNQLRFVIHADGGIVEYQYTDEGHVEAERVYDKQWEALALELSNLPTLDALQAFIAQENPAYTGVKRTYDAFGNIATQATIGREAGGEEQSTALQAYVFDDDGKILFEQSASGASKTYYYDGIGRNTTVLNSDGDQTKIDFIDSQRQVQQTAADGKITLKTFDTQGNLTTIIEKSSDGSSQTLENSYFYDSRGLLIAEENTAGERRFYIYNERQQQVAVIDASGQLTQTYYNADGLSSALQQYSGRVDTRTWASNDDSRELESILSAYALNAELTQYNVYDASGNVVFEIDNAGFVTEYLYDGNERLSNTRQHQTPVSPGLLNPEGIQPETIYAELYGDLYAAISTVSEDVQVAPEQDFPITETAEVHRIINSVQDISAMITNEVSYRNPYQPYGMTTQAQLQDIAFSQQTLTVSATQNTLAQYDLITNVQQDQINTTAYDLAISSAFSSNSQTLSWQSPIQLRDFSGATTGFSDNTDTLSVANGELILSQSQTSVDNNMAISSSVEAYASDGFAMSMDIDTTTTTSSGKFYFGIHDNSDQGFNQSIFFYLTGPIAFAQTVKDGIVVANQFLGFVQSGASYQLKVNVDNGQSTIKLFPQGGDEDSGFTHTADISHWNQVNSMLATGSYPGAAESVVLIDNYSTQGIVAGSQYELVYQEQGSDTWQSAAVSLNSGAYQANLSVSAGRTYAISMLHKNAAGDLLALVQDTFVAGVSTSLNTDYQSITTSTTALSGQAITGYALPTDIGTIASVKVKIYDYRSNALVDELTTSVLSQGDSPQIILSESGALADNSYRLELAFLDITDTTLGQDNLVYHTGQPDDVMYSAISWPALAATGTANFYYKTPSASDYQQVAVATTNGVSTVWVEAEAPGNIEYKIEYVDDYGRVINSVDDSLLIYDHTNTVEEEALTVLTLSSETITGSAMTHFSDPSIDASEVDYFFAQVIDQTLGEVVSTAITYPSAYDDYHGQLNLSTNDALADGLYNILVIAHYMDGSSSSAITIEDYEIGEQPQFITQSFSWNYSGVPEDAVGTFKYRVSGSDEWSVLAIERNGDGFSVSVPNLQPWQMINYEIAFSSAAYNDFSLFSQGSVVATPVANETKTLSFAESNLTKEAVSGHTALNVLADYDFAAIDFISATVYDKDTFTAVGSALTYPELYTDYQGEVNLITSGVLDDGRYEAHITVQYLDGSQEALSFYYELGLQDKTQSTVTVELPRTLIDAGNTLYYQVQPGESSDYQLAELDATNSHYIIEITDFDLINMHRVFLRVENASGDVVDINTLDLDIHRDGDKLVKLWRAPDAKSPVYRSSQIFYDAQDRIIGVVDAEGFLLESIYNVQGQLIETVRYAQESDGNNVAVSSLLADYRPAASSADEHHHYIYNVLGQKIAEVDAEGYLTEWTYTATGQVATQVVYTQAVDYSGQAMATLRSLASSSEQVNRTIEYRYDDLDRRYQTIDNFGGTQEVAYDAVGRVVSSSTSGEVDSMGELQVRAQYTRYNALGQLESELAGTHAALLDAASEEEKEALWQLLATTYEYQDGKLTAIEGVVSGTIDDISSIEREKFYIYYDDSGRKVLEVAADLSVTEYLYDDLGRQHAVRQLAAVLPATTPLTGGVITSELTALLSTLYSEQDAVITQTFNERGLLQTVSDTLGETQGFAYNAFGEVATQTMVGGDDTTTHTTAFDYNDRGQLIRSTTSAGTLTTVSETREYDVFGRLDTINHSDGSQVTYDYDKLGQLVLVENSAGQATHTVYDAFKRILTVTNQFQQSTEYHYDDSQHAVTVTLADGSTVTQRNNDFGERVLELDPRDSDIKTQWSYNEDGMLLNVSYFDGDSLLKTESQDYDLARNTIETVDANGVTATMRYDAVGQLIETIYDPATSENAEGLNHKITYAFDGKGNRIKETQYLGTEAIVTEYEFDARNRTVQVIYDAEGLARTTTIEYNQNGQQTQVTEAAGTDSEKVTQYIYDALGRRIETVQDPNGLGLSNTFHYNERNQLVKAVDALGYATIYAYDAHGREKLKIDALGAVTETYYDAESRVVATRVYDHLVSSEHLNASIEDLSDDQYLFDLGVLFTSEQDSLSLIRYDELGRQVESAEYLGNAQWSVAELFYDANGNLIGKRALASKQDGVFDESTMSLTGDWQLSDHDQQTRYIYNALNQQIALLELGEYAESPAIRIVANTYDAMGNLTETHAYANWLMVVEDDLQQLDWEALGDQIQDNIANDRIVQHVYNAANEQVYSLEYYYDGTEHRARVNQRVYDDLGRITHQTQYGDYLAIEPGQALSKAEVAQKIIEQNLDDVSANQHAQWFYDNLGQTTAQISYLFDETNDQFYGHVTSMAYDDAGQLVLTQQFAETIAEDIPSVSELALANWMTSATTGAQTTRMYYDQIGRDVLTINAAGYASEKTYDAQNNMRSLSYYTIADLALLDTEFSLAAAEGILEQLATQTNEQGLLGKITASYTYNARGQLESQTDARNYTESFKYDALGQMIEKTDKGGFVWSYEYDQRGMLAKETTPAVEQLSFNTSTQAFDSIVAGIVTEYQYDALGQLVSVANAVGTERETHSEFEYDTLGRQVLERIQNGGEFDRTTKALNHDDLWRVSTQSYDVFDNVIVEASHNGATKLQQFDSLNRLVYTMDALGYVTKNDYDALNNLSVVTRYADNTSIDVTAFKLGNDTISQKVGAVNSDDRQVIHTYDSLGRKIQTELTAMEVSDGIASYTLKPTTKFYYDAFSRVTQESRLAGMASGEEVWIDTFSYYDELGNKLAFVDAEGYLSQWQYDHHNNVLVETEYARKLDQDTDFSTQPAAPSAGDATIGFDRITRYQYNELNQLVNKSMAVQYATLVSSSDREFANVSGTRSITYDYNALGYLSEQIDDQGVLTTTEYNALGSKTKQSIHGVTHAALTDLVITETTVDRHMIYHYDSSGNIVIIEEALAASDGALLDNRKTLQWFDHLGRIVGSRNAIGQESFTTYDYYDQWVERNETQTFVDDLATVPTNSMSYALDKSIRTYFDLTGREVAQSQTALVDGTEQWLTYASEFNGFGELSTQKRHLGAYENPGTEYTYASNVYNVLGQLERSTQQGITKDYEYNVLGYLVREYGGFSDTTYIRDVAGRVVEQREKSTTVVTLVDSTGYQSEVQTPTLYSVFDRWGNLIEYTNERGVTSTFQYNQDNQRTQDITFINADASAGESATSNQYVYNRQGLAIATLNANGAIHTKDFDAQGLLIGTADAYNHSEQYYYDAWGNKVGFADAAGTLHYYEYNEYDQLIEQGIIGVETDLTLGAVDRKHRLKTFAYDSSGHQVRETLHRVQTSIYGTFTTLNSYSAYDQRGLVVAYNSAEGVSTQYELDLAGNRSKAVDGNGRETSWHYDQSTGLLLARSDLSGRYYRYTYEHNQIATEGFYQDATSTTPLVLKQYDYYDNGKLKWVDNEEAVRAMAYDISGNIVLSFEANAGAGKAGSISYDVVKSVGELYGMEKFVQQLSEQPEYNTQLSRTEYIYNRLGHLTQTQQYGNILTNDSDLIPSGFDEVTFATDGLDLMATVSYTYDAVGNKTAIESYYYDPDSNLSFSTLKYAFTYDLHNRVIAKTALKREEYNVFGGGYEWDLLEDTAIQYNALGNYQEITQIKSDGVGGFYANGSTKNVDYNTYEFFYNRAGFATTKRLTLTTTKSTAINNNGELSSTVVDEDSQYSSTTTIYDDHGRVLKAVDGDQETIYRYYSNGRLYQQETDEAGTYYILYDDAGNLLSYQSYGGSNGTLYHEVSYALMDSYVEKTITTSKNSSNDIDSDKFSTELRSDKYFNAWGDEVYIEGRQNGDDFERYYFQNVDGMISARRDLKPDDETHYYLYHNGSTIGSYGEIGEDNFDYVARGVGSLPTSTSVGYYEVQTGDTLNGIASRVWGDASLWYLIADENGISGDADLIEGQRLRLPTINAGTTNNSQSYAPYNSQEILGDIVPTPAVQQGGCNGVAIAIMVIVAVVVTIYTAGAAASVFAPTATGVAGATTGAAGAAVLGGTAGFSAGIAASAFVGGVAGSVASQLVGKGLGVVESFSLRSAVASGITSVAAAGIGYLSGGAKQLEQANKALEAAKNANQIGMAAEASRRIQAFSAFKNAGSVASRLGDALNAYGGALQAVASYGASYAANRIANEKEQMSFRWSALAANVMASSVSTSINGLDKSTGFLTEVRKNLVSGGLAATTSRLLDNGGEQVWGDIAGNAVGSALGNRIVSNMDQYATEKQIEQKIAQVGDIPASMRATAEKMIRNGIEPEKVRQFVTNDNISGGLSRINNIMSEQLAPVLNSESQLTGEYALLDGQRVGITLLSPKSELMLEVFSGAEQVVRGASELTKGLPIEEVIELTTLALLGPAKYLFDKGVGYATEYLGGKYIADMLDTAGEVLTAAVYGEPLKDTEALIDYSNRFKEAQKEALFEEEFNKIPLEERVVMEKTFELGEERAQAKTGALALVSLVAAALGAKEGIGLLRNKLNSAKLSQLEKDRLMNETRMEADHDMDKVPDKTILDGISATRFEGLVDEFAGFRSARGFNRWKQSLVNEGLTPAQIQEAVYQGTLKRGENLWKGDWKRYYEEISGTQYPGQPSHAHHLVEKGSSSPAAIENRRILEEVGINPLLNRENLTWAPNITGQHGAIPQGQLLEMLSPVRGNRDGVVNVLQQWAEIAKARN